MQRRKLFDGAVITHSYFGLLTIRVTYRPQFLRSPYLWEAINAKGQLAVPSTFSEKELHKHLKKWYAGVYRFE